MAFAVPVAVNYQSPLLFIPSRLNNEPSEGPGLISCEIDWGVMGGANNTVDVNPQTNTANPQSISQITSLSIDNSQCGAPVTFLFPDTQYTLTIPAYLPAAVFPVFTNATQFFVSSPLAETEDVTRFQILNFVPPPVVIPQATQQEAENFNDVPIDGATSQVLVGPTISGTIEGITVYCTITSAGATATDRIKIVDGNNNIVAASQINVTSGQAVNTFVIQLNPARIRFQGGLTFEQSGGNPGGFFSITLLFQTP
jgi:hypothetical protein